MHSLFQPSSARVGVAALAVAVLLGATGCGSSDPTTDDAVDTVEAVDTVAVESSDAAEADGATTSDPATTDAATTDDESTQRIVSLSPTHTEMMFAIGAGDQLVAVDDNSNYPAEALELPHDLSAFEPNVEAIAALEPDLVLIGGDFNGLGEQLQEVGIASWDGPAAVTIDDVYTQIEQLGAATGHVGEAAELVGEMQTEIAQIIADTPQPDEPLTVYHEIDNTYFSADSTTFIGEVYAKFGLRNIADTAEGDHFGYPQLNAEAIISANPDLIFIPCGTYCTTTAAEVASRPGWDTITAVQNGGVIEVDEDLASRWGPRIVDYYAAVGTAVAQTVQPV